VGQPRRLRRRLTPLLPAWNKGRPGRPLQAEGLPHSDRNAGGCKDLAAEPRPARPPAALPECKLVVNPKAGEHPGSGVAKTFAGVAAPGRGAPARVGRSEFALAPLRAPAQLAPSTPSSFAGQQPLPAPARRIGKANPGKMENFVYQDALEVPAAGQDLRVQQDQAPWNGSGGKMAAQRAAHLNPERPAGEGRQPHGYLFG
jgi:hypothetical protein